MSCELGWEYKIKIEAFQSVHLDSGEAVIISRSYEHELNNSVAGSTLFDTSMDNVYREEKRLRIPCHRFSYRHAAKCILTSPPLYFFVSL